MDHGFDYDLAFKLDYITATAYMIIISEHNSGRKFNFHTMDLEEGKK